MYICKIYCYALFNKDINKIKVFIYLFIVYKMCFLMSSEWLLDWSFYVVSRVFVWVVPRCTKEFKVVI